MTSDQTVSILVPAYRSERFIRGTLESVMAQSFKDIRLVVAIDPAEDGDQTYQHCLPFADDERVEVTVNATRRGWVGNVNGLLDQVTSPYFMLLFHDDRINSSYVETLVKALQDRPDAVNAYPTVELVGDVSRTITYDAPDDSLERRLETYLTQPSHAVFQRGVTRKSVLDAGARLPENDCNGFLSDIVYSIQMLCEGPCIHVPRARYSKLTWGESVSKQWFTSEPMEQLSAAAKHYQQCASAIDQADISAEDKLKLKMFRMFQLVSRLRSAKAFGEIGPEFAIFSSLVMLGTDQQEASDAEVADAVSSISEPSLLPVLAKIKYFDAVEAMEADDPVAAAAAFGDAARLDPADPFARINHALMLSKLGLFEKAEAVARSAVDLAPANARALGILAQLCVKNSRPDDAVEYARRALALDKDHVGAKRILDAHDAAPS